jgi:sugar phosphate isomerase/epimerase
MAFPLGVVDLAFVPDSPERAAERARDLQFDHIDVRIEVDPTTLVLPVGCPLAQRPAAQFCSALPRRTWEHTITVFRDAPGALLEPGAASVVNSNEKVRAMCAEVPGLRILLDTGHVADWGGDPLELVDLAAHVQLRQGKPGHTQLHVDDPAGTVDFGALLRRLGEVGYTGLLSIEYFDLPDYGWPLDDPLDWTLDMARHVRGLMSN